MHLRLSRPRLPMTLSALALAGCTAAVPPASPPQDAPLANGFRLVSLNGAPEGAGYSLDLRPDGSFGGSMACNSYSGRNAATLPAFRAVDVTSTLAACVDPAPMAADGAYLDALARVRRIEAGPDRMTATGDGVSLVYERP